MPCNDCSRTEECPPCPEEEECRCGPGEKCGVCFESKEPKGSERSSTNRCCRCGQPVEWIDYAGDPGWSHSRGATTRCTRPKPDLRCECGALWSQHAGGKGSCYGEDCECMQFRCDHTRCGWKPRDEPKRLSLTAVCACSHVNNWHVRADHNDTRCAAPECPCGAFRASSDPECPQGNGPHCRDHGWYCCHCGVRLRDVPKPCTCGPDEACGDPCDYEPPLTPEEEEVVAAKFEAADAEHLPPPEAICGNCYTDHAQGSCEPSEPPPQPERRPPYVIAYSVQGHLFEVALPGDATVRAVDGALVIQHHLGPVAGIVSVMPVINKETD